MHLMVINFVTLSEGEDVVGALFSLLGVSLALLANVRRLFQAGVAFLLEGKGEKCGMQPHCAFFGYYGRKEIEEILRTRSFWTKD